LLKGREITEISLRELRNGNFTFRFDSEYLQKSYLSNLKKLKSYPNGYIHIRNVVEHISGGATPLGADYQEKQGVPFLRVQNIMRNYIDLTDIVYIVTAQDEEIKRSRLKEKDVLLTITGSYGKSAVVPRSLIDANINQHSVKITLKENINPYFLSTFLNSKYGKFQSDKNIVGITRPALDYEAIKNFIIPNAPKKFQSHIETIILESEKTNIQSQQLYRQAEELLLENIGLKKFKPSQENKNIKTLKESFLKTARLDAEYYQPKYENYIKLSENYSEGSEPLQKICKLKDENFIPKDEEKYKYIELSNVDKFGNITSYYTDDGINLPSRARRKVNTNDIIISSVEGSLDSCALITKDYDNAICSTGFYVINSSNINSQTLLILFKSELMQNILKQNCSGTILTAINKNEFQNIPIPLIDHKIQTEIADLVNKSFALRQESEKLLEQAEKSVEEKIENSKQF
jgi:restriction endonuclease S subunit